MYMENEGFYFIDTRTVETFAYGRIVDVHDKVVCPGVILVYPISDGTHGSGICYTTPYIHGINVRIYWEPLSRGFNVSTASRVYPGLDLPPGQVDFDMVDRTKCYYGILTATQIILTHIIDRLYPVLSVPDLSDDLAFVYHWELTKCVAPLPLKNGKQVYIQNDGTLLL